MKPYELHLYTVDMKYIRNLASVDDHVLSVSPQVGKSIRPFLGIVVLVNGRKKSIIARLSLILLKLWMSARKIRMAHQNCLVS